MRESQIISCSQFSIPSLSMRFSDSITLQTPESVEIEFTLAGVGNRCLALLIDYGLWGLILSCFVYTWSFLAEQTIDILSDFLKNTDSLDLWLAAIAILVTFTIYVGYFVIFETLWQGQTPGKRFAKIRVICDNGRPAGLSQSTLRALLRPFDDLFFIGFILMALTPREKRIGDWIAGTLVVQTRNAIVKKPLHLSDAAQGIADRLLESADFSQILPDDFAVIREYLQRRSTLETNAKRRLSLELAKEIQGIIDLLELPEDMPADLFLEAVYIAYQRSEGQVL